VASIAWAGTSARADVLHSESDDPAVNREPPAMRVIAISLLAVPALLAGCGGPHEVAAAPPSVSYQVTGNDVGQAGVNAERYCNQYGRSAQFQGIQSTASGNVAVYTCSRSR